MMEIENISSILDQQYANETPLELQLRKEACDIITRSRDEKDEKLPSTLLELLTKIIKPQFTASKHPALRSTGRKNLVSPVPTIGRFNSPIDNEDIKLWKNKWTVPLLTYILTTYRTIKSPELAKSTLESHFPLLTPPILNILDDIDSSAKASGCNLLTELCKSISFTKSPILSRSGLTEVFISTLRPNFNHLPTLTPEDESLTVLTALYPAYLAVVEADSPSTTPRRQSNLDHLLRHGIVASILHLANPTAPTSASISLPITTLLLQQLVPTISALQIQVAKHLQILIPLLRAVLSDPFAPAAPESLHAAIVALDTVIQTCKPRVKERWWVDILRAFVAAWCAVLDEEDDETKGKQQLTELKTLLRKSVSALGEVVGEGFDDARKRLCSEEEDLEDLFVGV